MLDNGWPNIASSSVQYSYGESGRVIRYLCLVVECCPSESIAFKAGETALQMESGMILSAYLLARASTQRTDQKLAQHRSPLSSVGGIQRWTTGPTRSGLCPSIG